MTYRLALVLLGGAILSAACSSANDDKSESGSENSPGDGDSGDGDSGDGDSGGDGDQVFVGSGGAAGSGGNTLGGGGTVVGSGGDVLGSGGGSGGDILDAGDGDGDGDVPPPGDGDAPAGAGGAPQGTGGTASSGSGGSVPGENCTPNDAGGFVVVGETVLDERTCLTWMRDNTTGDPYAEAVAYCEALSLGGYDDWRIPTAGEVGTIFKCDGMWPPIDDTIFNVMGDGIWTTTETGTIAGDLPKVCGAGQSSGNFYDFGQVGGQNTRCVRGTSTVPDRADCVMNPAICQ